MEPFDNEMDHDFNQLPSIPYSGSQGGEELKDGNLISHKSRDSPKFAAKKEGVQVWTASNPNSTSGNAGNMIQGSSFGNTLTSQQAKQVI